ncbi:hypothetical protein [Kitasatospora purpeofusca]|uniref:hypothetical protein n=1 Tax=Kitasatospora purpeofusca TaxID=67352 RepID=UPI00369876C6
MSTMLDELVPRGVMRFANAAARSAAITAPEAGMTSWLVAEGRLEIYSGTAWRAYSPAGQWATYVPTWSARFGSGPQPTLGNGTLTSRWIKQDRRVTWYGHLVYGTLSSPGEGLWYMSLPTPAASVGMAVHGVANYAMLGENQFLGVSVLGPGDDAIGFVVSQTTTHYSNNVSDWSPIAAAPNAELFWSIEYESAS